MFNLAFNRSLPHGEEIYENRRSSSSIYTSNPNQIRRDQNYHDFSQFNGESTFDDRSFPPILKKQEAELRKVQNNRKITEDIIYKALNKQTELLGEIARRLKHKSEEEQDNLLKKIKNLEQDKNEILYKKSTEDLINQKFMEKLEQLNEWNSVNFDFNPHYQFLQPYRNGFINDDEDDEPPKKKKKKSRKKKKISE